MDETISGKRIVRVPRKKRNNIKLQNEIMVTSIDLIQEKSYCFECTMFSIVLSNLYIAILTWECVHMKEYVCVDSKFQ